VASAQTTIPFHLARHEPELDLSKVLAIICEAWIHNVQRATRTKGSVKPLADVGTVDPVGGFRVLSLLCRQQPRMIIRVESRPKLAQYLGLKARRTRQWGFSG